MKISKSQYFITILLGGFLFCLSSVSVAQCEEDEFHDNCASNIQYIVSDYIYLKSHPFFSEIDKKIYFPLTLRRNNEYIISVCDKYLGGESINLKLYGPDKKLIVETAGKNKKTAHQMSVKCSRSGKYYVVSSFPRSSDPLCCGLMLGVIDSFEETTYD